MPPLTYLTAGLTVSELVAAFWAHAKGYYAHRFTRGAELPKDVRDALAKAAGLKQAAAETDRQVRDRQQRVNVIGQEQARLQENMKTVAQNTEYYQRLLKKLDEQESAIEALQKEVAALQKTAEGQRVALEECVNGLTVG